MENEYSKANKQASKRDERPYMRRTDASYLLVLKNTKTQKGFEHFEPVAVRPDAGY
jgi:hypothetical protein